MPSRVEPILADLVARHFEISRDDVDLSMPLESASDSLKLSELVVALEQRFGVVLEDSAIAQARVLRDLAALVERKLPSGAQ